MKHLRIKATDINNKIISFIIMTIFCCTMHAQQIVVRSLPDAIEKVMHVKGKWYKPLKDLRKNAFAYLENDSLLHPTSDTIYVIGRCELYNGFWEEDIILNNKIIMYFAKQHKLKEITLYPMDGVHDKIIDIVTKWDIDTFTRWHSHEVGFDRDWITVVRFVRQKQNKYRYSIYQFNDNTDIFFKAKMPNPIWQRTFG